MTQDIFLDVGDLYTKCHVLCADNGLRHNICFPTIAAEADAARGTCSHFKDVETETYKVVGWDAVDGIALDDVARLRRKATAFDIFNKILFGYIDDQSTVNINFIADEAHDDIQLENAEEIYDKSRYHVEGFVNGSYVTRNYTVNLSCHMVSDILACSFQSSTLRDTGQGVVIAVDIGFCNTKVFIIDTESYNVVYEKLPHGFDYFLVKVNDHFDAAGINLHPFVMLKELERSNAVIDTDNGVYDISKIIDNVRFDFGNALVDEIDEVLRRYYHSFLVWPGFLYITGGGAAMGGDVVAAALVSRYGRFRDACLIESRPRDYLVRACRRLFV